MTDTPQRRYTPEGIRRLMVACRLVPLAEMTEQDFRHYIEDLLMRAQYDRPKRRKRRADDAGPELAS